MKKKIIKLLDIIFPVNMFIKFISANKKINKKIDEVGNQDQLENGDNPKHDYDIMLPYFRETIEVKKTLEDKAKIGVVGISLCATIIFGLLGLLFSMHIDFTQLNMPKVILIIMSAMLIFYINAAGILALIVIGEKNQIYCLSLEESKKGKVDQAKLLASHAERNIYLNTLRNNYVYVSFRCLIYGVVILSLMVPFIAMTSLNKDETKKELLKAVKEGVNLIGENAQYNRDTRKEVEAMSLTISSFNTNLEGIGLDIDKIDIKIKELEFKRKEMESNLLRRNNKTEKLEGDVQTSTQDKI